MTDRELMQMALDALQESKPIDINDPTAFYRSAHAIEALRTALAAKEPEPVAYDVSGATVYIKPPIHNGKYLTGYTAPPKREWQSLTDEEVKRLYKESRQPKGAVVRTAEQLFETTCRAIEAKLKEKNT